MPQVRVALAQTNPTVGDIEGNLRACLAAVEAAATEGANLVLFGEMVVTGYPIEDLAQRRDFIEAAEASVGQFAQRLADEGYGELSVVLGHPSLVRASAPSADHWILAHNSASVLRHGQVAGTYHKAKLPNYGVFDEYRSFAPGTAPFEFEHGGLRFDLLICEDIWQLAVLRQLHGERRPDATLVLNGSPFELEKQRQRIELAGNLARDRSAPVFYCNLVGGQDDLVFDGDSFVVSSDGSPIARAASFTTDMIVVDLNSAQPPRVIRSAPLAEPEPTAAVWQALTLGLGDYVRKNGFGSVILGLSGGIDSAVCAAIAADALGAERVFGVTMPSRFSSEHSILDARDLATRLGIALRNQPIEPLVEPVVNQLDLSGIAAENAQARVRGLILMSLSNQEGHLVLTTGNKSELAVGYSTIYGDSVGGFAPLKDVPKTLVWQLARWRNARAIERGEVPPIPESSIIKAPSAELRPDQTDQDSLPEYSELDAILADHIHRRQGREALLAGGHSPELVDQVLRLVAGAEWKRRQSAIGPKISDTAFGRDRRLPITNRYHEN